MLRNSICIVLAVIEMCFQKMTVACRWKVELQREKEVEARRLIRNLCRDGKILDLLNMIGFGNVRKCFKKSYFRTGGNWKSVGSRVKDKYKLKRRLCFLVREREQLHL